MDPPPVWIGLDVGTQSVRAMVVAADGTVVGRGVAALSSVRDGVRHEQDPRAWWAAVAAACGEALRTVAPERVRGIATCATSGTVLLVDRAGAPLTAGVMYDDARADAAAARPGATGPRRALRGAPITSHPRNIRARPGATGPRRALGSAEAGQLGATFAGDRARARASGGLTSAAPALRKLRWMLDAWPELARGARLAHQADVITRALVGRTVPSDASHALKTGYDVEREAWPELDLPAGLLPDVVRSGSRLGEVCAGAAAQTGIPAGTPVIAGMTDGCAAQLAAGALAEGDWNSVLGTTLVLKGYSARVVRDPGGVLYSHRAPDGGWLPGGASSTGAGVLSARFGGCDLAELGRRAEAFEQTSVLAYPLVSRGERFPFAAPDAEPFVLGVPRDEAELYAALLLGVAFVERLCFDYVDLLGAPTGGELTLTGGATASRYWCQLRAGVLGRAVRLVEQPEAAFGMAVLAASVAGDLAAPARADLAAPVGADLAAPVGADPAAPVGADLAAPVGADLAAPVGADLAAVAAGMVRTRDVIEPRPDRAEPFTERYLRLLDELERRGWLGAPLAAHARARSAT